MTQTYSLATARHLILACAFLALAFFAYMPLVHASEGDTGTTTTSTSTPPEVKKDVKDINHLLGKSLDKRNPRSILQKIEEVKRRIAQLTLQKAAYEDLLVKLQSAVGSSTGSTTPLLGKQGKGHDGLNGDHHGTTTALLGQLPPPPPPTGSGEVHGASTDGSSEFAGILSKMADQLRALSLKIGSH